VSGDFAIRTARAGDEDGILALLWDFAVFEKLTHIFELTRETVARDFVGPAARVRCDVAECDGAIAGVMIWFRTYGTFRAQPVVYLEDIFVAEPYRRRGIGTAFLKRLAQHAVEEGACRMDWIVLDWNARAIDFYRRIGASLPGEWRICRIEGEALTALARP
jgi:GNAT superfamily N-acetyltransferase